MVVDFVFLSTSLVYKYDLGLVLKKSGCLLRKRKFLL